MVRGKEEKHTLSLTRSLTAFHFIFLAVWRQQQINDRYNPHKHNTDNAKGCKHRNDNRK